jgi:SAM-dependent methyltransferase
MINKYTHCLILFVRGAVGFLFSIPKFKDSDTKFISFWVRQRELEDGEIQPYSETGRSLLKFWFEVQKFADSKINQICSTYYDGKHPKHYLWLGHNQFLYDRVHEHERVLDIGCGGSHYQQWLAQKAAEVVGVDILPDRIQMSVRNNTSPNVRYELIDVTERLPQGDFDVVICSHVLEHLDDPVSLLRKLASRVPRLLVKVPLVDSHWMKLVKKDIGMPWLDDGSHRREYTEEMLLDQLKESGWQITEIIRGYDLRASAKSSSFPIDKN